MQLFLVLLLASGIPGFAFAQDASSRDARVTRRTATVCRAARQDFVPVVARTLDMDRRAVPMEERRVDLQGQGHDFGAAALGLGRQAMGVLRCGLGETGNEEGHLQPDGRSWRPRRGRRRRAGSGRHRQRARSASLDDHGVRMDGRVRGATHSFPGLAPVLPLPLVPPARVLPPAPGVPQRTLSRRDSTFDPAEHKRPKQWQQPERQPE